MMFGESVQEPAQSIRGLRRLSRDWLLLALLWLAHAVALILWLRLDNRFPAGEMAVQLTRALGVADALGRPALDVLSRVAAASAGQPPLPYVATAPLIWLAGRGPDPATLVNLAWLALLLASVYGIVRRLFPLNHSIPLSPPPSRPPIHWPALAAAALVSLYPLVVVFTRIYDPALAVAALAALAIWLLVESDYLQRRPYALGFTLAVVAGTLAGPAFWAAALGPTLIALGLAVRTARPARTSRRAPSRNAFERLARRLRLAPVHVNLLLVLLLILLLTLPYVLAYPSAASAGGAETGQADSGGLLLRMGPWLDDALGGVLSLVLLAGVGYALWHVVRPQSEGQRLAFGLPLAWLGGGFIVLTLLGDDSAGQIMPLLPAAAVLSVAWLAGLIRRPAGEPAPAGRSLRRSAGLAVAGIAAVVAVVNALVIAWGAPAAVAAALRAPAGSGQPFVANAPLWAPGRALYQQWAPQRVKSQTAAIGQAAERICDDQASCRAVVLSCLPALGSDAFDFFLAQAGLAERLAFQGLAPNVNFYFDLWDADFVLEVGAGHGCAAAADEALARRMDVVQSALASPEFSQRFRQVEAFDLPGGAQAQLWRRVGPPIAQMDIGDQVLALEHVLDVSPNASAASQALSSALDQIGDPLRGLALREEIVARNPEDAAARVALGDAYLTYGRPQDAVEQYQAALGGDGAAGLASEGDASAALSMTRSAVLLKLADATSALGQWQQAEAALAQAVELAPDDYTTQLRLGQFYVQRGRFADATSALAEARGIDPQRYETYLALAQAQLLRNDLALAEEQFRLAQEVAPGAPQPLLVQADALAARGDLSRAVALYDQAVALAGASGPDTLVVDAYARWVTALQAQGEPGQARTLAETLARTYPSSPQAQQTLAGLYQRQGLAEEAVAAYQAALELAPLDAGIRAALAQTLAGLGRYDDAEALLAAGLALPSGRAELLSAQADVLLATLDPDSGRAVEALDAYQEALQANPVYWPAAAGLAQLYLARGQTDQALQAVDAALENRPDPYVLHALRGDALVALGRRSEALTAYRQAIELAPQPLSPADPANAPLAQLHASLGELQLAARNFNAAGDSFEQALRYDPSYAPAYVGQARLDTTLALRQDGDAGGSALASDQARFQRTAAALETALALDPASVTARAALGDLYAAYGRSDEAIVAYQEALALDPEAAAGVHSQLFDLYLAQGRSDEVVAFYRQLLRDKPDSVEALVGLADAYLAAGQPDRALEAYDLFLVQNRDSYLALMAQGATLRQVGDAAALEQALAAYQRAARVAPAPRQLPPWIEQARTLTTLGRLEEAEAAYRQALQLVEDPARGSQLGGDLSLPYTGLARLLLSQGRNDEALALADAALAAYPDVAAVQILAGDLSQARGRRAEALAAFRRAAELAPDNAVAQTRIGDLQLQAGNLAEAQAAYRAALDSDPANTSGLLGLGRALSRAAAPDAGDGLLLPEQEAGLAQAEELLRTLLDQQPDASQAAQLVLGDVLFAQGRLDEAAEAYQAVLLADPDSATAIEGLARTLLAGGNEEDALAAYQAAADSAATTQVRNRWLMTLASAYRSLGRSQQAEQTYLAMLDAGPANSEARLALGDLYQAGERIDEAIEQYRLAVAADPNDLSAASRLGRTLLRAGRVDEAASIAQDLLAASPSAYESYLLAARVAEAQGDPAAALAGLRQAQSLAPTNSAAQALIGDSYLTLGRPDDAASAYSTAVALEPRNSSALVGLGRINLARERLDEAEASLRRALAAAPTNLAAQATLGRVLLQDGRAAEAVPLLEAAVAQNAAHPTAVQDLADAYLAVGRSDDGLAIYRTGLGLSAGEQPLAIGAALIRAGRTQEGLAELQALVEQRPDDPRGLLALAQGYQQAGEMELAAGAFQQAVEAAPGDLTLRVLQGNFLLGQQESQPAADAFQAALDLAAPGQPGQPATSAAGVDAAEPWQAWIGLARAYQQLGRYDDALAAAGSGQALRPDLAAFPLQIGDIQRAAGRLDEALAAYGRAAALGTAATPLTRQGELYLALEQPDQALAAFEQALAIAPEDAGALLGLAQAYALRGGGVDQGDFANAETRLRRAAQLAPDSPNVPLALGDLYAVYGRYDDAAAQYRAALALNTDDPVTLRRLASVLLNAGDAEAALAVHEQRLEQAPGDRSGLLDLAFTYRALQRYDEAEAAYRQLLRQAAGDVDALIGLGDLYLEQGLASQAAPLYQQAREAASDPLLAAQAADQLGKAYLRLGETGQALAVATGLVQEQPTADRGYLLLGSVYEAQNDPDAALASYQQGIEQAETTLPLQLRLGELYLRLGRAADAQALYEALTKSSPRSVDAYVGLARAHIAQLPDLQALRFEWASEALSAALRLNPNATAALAAQGDLLAAYQQPAEAASAYAAALASRSAASADDSALRLKLADALAAAGQWEGALQEYQRLAIANPGDLGMQMALGNAYRLSGRSQQALAQYRRVNQSAPAYPFAYIKLGEVLDELGQAAQALTAYQAAVTAAPDNADVVLTLAVAYRKRGMTDEAIAAFETGLALDPGRESARLALEQLRTTGK